MKHIAGKIINQHVKDALLAGVFLLVVLCAGVGFIVIVAGIVRMILWILGVNI